MLQSDVLPVAHGFSTRAGGVSEGVYAGLNLSLKTADNPQHVLENQERFLANFGVHALLHAQLDQVHGTTVHWVQHGGTWEGDGLITRTPGVLLTVTTADCYPVLLHDPEQGIVAALHAGWRGVVGGIVPKALAMMQQAGSNMAQVRMAVGPGIGQQAFEVSQDVAQAFGQYPYHVRVACSEPPAGASMATPRVAVFEAPPAGASMATPRVPISAGEKSCVALDAVLKQQALEGGVLPQHLWVSGVCTYGSREYYSHRRDQGVTGRMWSGIML